MRLFRPVGLFELNLIAENEYQSFPPRLEGQPFFYPVLNLDYARYIAKEWNVKDRNSGFAGFVTQFDIDDDYVSQFAIHVVGNNTHQELWIPAEQLNEFNQHILNEIIVVESYYGKAFDKSFVPKTKGEKEIKPLLRMN